MYVTTQTLGAKLEQEGQIAHAETHLGLYTDNTNTYTSGMLIRNIDMISKAGVLGGNDVKAYTFLPLSRQICKR